MVRSLKQVLAMILSILLVGCGAKNKSTVATDDVRELRRESEHFEFYLIEKDTKCLDDLEKNLEDNYEKISENLRVTLKSKIKVNIYPSIEEFHSNAGISNPEDWMVGVAKEDEILMVSPLNPGKVHNYEGLMQVVVHEFTHILVGKINSSTDTYLNEGIAVVESKQIDKNMKRWLKKASKEDKLPRIEEMRNNLFGLKQPYCFAGGFMDFLVNEYGYDKVVEIIGKNVKLEETTGLDKEELWVEWKQYIDENY